MLGRLCRWLRALGVDAEQVQRSQPAGALEAARLVTAAAAAGRVFVTRDAWLAVRRDCAGAFLLQSEEAEGQLAELARHFRLEYDER